MDATTALRKLYQLIGKLASPIPADLQKEGWKEESAEDLRRRLEALRQQIELSGILPPRDERPLNMIRYLDSWGIQDGQLVEEVAAFENELRHA